MIEHRSRHNSIPFQEQHQKLLAEVREAADLEDPDVNRAKDILGRVYEYFLAQFASAEEKNGSQFYTPRCVVRVLVEMLAPYKGRVYDPCCGSAGKFVQSEKLVEVDGGRLGDIAVYGQEPHSTTRRLAISDWHRSDEDVRWKYGLPPKGNANFAWVQHFIHHLSPSGSAGFVLANGSMSSNQSGEGEIRKAIIDAGLVDCMVALPGQLFYSTQIPDCLWFLAKNNAVECEINVRLFGGETELSLVA